MGDERDRVAMRFARGTRCFVVMIDGAVAGYGWLSTGPEWVGEIQLEIRPGPGEGYVWNCVTLEKHRRKGVFRSLIVGISEAARRGGLRRLWIGTIAIPGESALAPSGFSPVVRFAGLAVGRPQVLLAAAWRLDPVTGTQALQALGAKPGLRIRRSQPRRH